MKKREQFKSKAAWDRYLMKRMEISVQFLSGILSGPLSQDNTNDEAVKLAVFLTDLLIEELEKKK